MDKADAVRCSRPAARVMLCSCATATKARNWRSVTDSGRAGVLGALMQLLCRWIRQLECLEHFPASHHIAELLDEGLQRGQMLVVRQRGAAV